MRRMTAGWVGVAMAVWFGGAAWGAANRPAGLPETPDASTGNLSAAYTYGNCNQFSYSATVTTDPGGGTDDFALEIWDDGTLMDTIALSAPADGGVHTVSGTYDIGFPVGTSAPGLGLYLMDGATLDTIDPFTCESAQAIPTLGGWGLAVLVLLLAAAGAFFVLRRRMPAAG